MPIEAENLQIREVAKAMSTLLKLAGEQANEFPFRMLAEGGNEGYLELPRMATNGIAKFLIDPKISGMLESNIDLGSLTEAIKTLRDFGEAQSLLRDMKSVMR